jgi:drug/metabolite transporter (DMT)-like permease
MTVGKAIGRTDTPASARLPLSAVLVLALLCFCWGGNGVAIKFSNQGMPPLMASALRSMIAALLAWLYARFMGRRVGFPPGQLRHGLIIGLLFGIEFLFLYWGLAYTPASRSAIFLATNPFWVALGAHFCLKGDRLTLPKILGLILAFGGVIVVFQTQPAELPELFWLGDLLVLIAAVFWAATTLYIKRISHEVSLDHYQTLFAQLAYSIPVLALGSLLFESFDSLDLNLVVVGGLLYQSVVVAFASYLVWFWMIHRYSVSRLASFTFMSPVFGVLLGGLVLDEPVTLMLWLGLGLVTCGVYAVNR